MPATPRDNHDVGIANPIIDRFDHIAEKISSAKDAISRIILGQPRVIEETLTTLLCGGHGLLVGLPGLGKTKLASVLATVCGLDGGRVQFTPDLMPADILGSEILDEGPDGKRTFRFVPGPIFCQSLLADEVNRASPRTQSALLEAMQERHVTVAGATHALPAPFHVFATQNPLEQEGTYPLPEAQLDRFFMRIDVDHPERDAERQVLIQTTGADEAQPETVLDAATLQDAQLLVRQMPVGESVMEAILTLTRQGRPETTTIDAVKNAVTWGPGPRAGQALMLGVRARALIDGRTAPSVDDVAALAVPVLRHRMALHFAARADGVNIRNVIARMCETLD